MTAPWDFGQAREASAEAARQQEVAEQELAAANRDYATAEEVYRKALAIEMWRLRREDGVAWSTIGDLARGDEDVAALKALRDDAEGHMLICRQALYRRAADRRDTERFLSWSERRDLAEGAGRVPAGSGPTYGERA